MRSARVEALVAYWEALTPASLARLHEVYAPGVHFRDPFHDVHGLEAVRAVFARMFETSHAPTFRIVETLEAGDAVLLVWDFDFRLKAWRPKRQRRIHGTSLVRFGGDARVVEHLDYWDAAGELYAQLPIIGPIVRALARAIARG